MGQQHNFFAMVRAVALRYFLRIGSEAQSFFRYVSRNISRPRQFALAALCCCVLLAGGYILFGTPSPDEPGPVKEYAAPQDATPAQAERTVRLKVRTDALPYEEALVTSVEEGVKKVDFALVKVREQLAMPRNAIQLEYVENRKTEGHEFHYQRMAVHVASAAENAAGVTGPRGTVPKTAYQQATYPTAETFIDTAGTALAIWAQGAVLLKTSDSTVLITVNAIPTHEIRFVTIAPEELVQHHAPKAGMPVPQVEKEHHELPDSTEVPDEKNLPARLAIVIDDLGESVRIARDIAALDYPVTFSIWPRATNAVSVARIAGKAGKEVMVHQPMEPMRYPQVKPGPGCVFVNMSRDQIRTIIAENVKLVPGAAGINNHMGSAFTQDTAGVAAVVSELQEHDLFVLDSYTHPKSVLYKVSGAAGLKTYKRNVFIDVVHDVASIVHQLKKAERIALSRGQAIAIGHPLKETVAALKEWGKHRNPAVRVVMVQNLAPITVE